MRHGDCELGRQTVSLGWGARGGVRCRLQYCLELNSATWVTSIGIGTLCAGHCADFTATGGCCVGQAALRGCMSKLVEDDHGSILRAGVGDGRWNHGGCRDGHITGEGETHFLHDDDEHCPPSDGFRNRGQLGAFS